MPLLTSPTYREFAFRISSAIFPIAWRAPSLDSSLFCEILNIFKPNKFAETTPTTTKEKIVMATRSSVSVNAADRARAFEYPRKDEDALKGAMLIGQGLGRFRLC